VSQPPPSSAPNPYDLRTLWGRTTPGRPWRGRPGLVRGSWCLHRSYDARAQYAWCGIGSGLGDSEALDWEWSAGGVCDRGLLPGRLRPFDVHVPWPTSRWRRPDCLLRRRSMHWQPRESRGAMSGPPLPRARAQASPRQGGARLPQRTQARGQARGRALHAPKRQCTMRKTDCGSPTE